MKKSTLLTIILTIVILSVIIFLIFRASPTGKVVMQEDSFPNTNSPHWTHMPVTYSIENCKNSETIKKAFSEIQTQTANSVQFAEAENPDITISCEILENCYQNKTERRWFWIITTEAICEHEAGTAQITKMKRNKILSAKINLKETEKPDACSETAIHEILHTFDVSHSEDPESIMYPEKVSDNCNEKIDSEIIDELVQKYN